MAYPTSTVQHTDLTKEIHVTIMQQYMRLDGIKGIAKKEHQTGVFSNNAKTLFQKTICEAEFVHQNLSAKLTEGQDLLLDNTQCLNFFNEKIKRLKAKYTFSTTAPQLHVPQVAQKLLSPQPSLPNGPQVHHQPILAKRNVSFAVSEAQEPIETSQNAPCISVTLNRISFLLRNNHEQQALEECKNLPDNVKRSVFGALWVVRGSPMPGNPIAHDNFGEVSFFNLEQRCTSTPQQKACAVELVKTEHSINEMISLFNSNKFVEAKAIFLTLPSQVQRAIYGKHWQVCDEPRDGHPMAHSNFGEVSFLKLDPRCDVPCAKRAETLSAYFPKFVSSSKAAQEAVPAEIELWKSIDAGRSSGPQKNDDKKTSIHAFSAKIIRTFLGDDAKIDIPAPVSPAYKALAAAYIESYPFLKPFLLQLENTLIFPRETLQNLPKQDGAKSSEKKDPKLGDMGYQKRAQYLTDIMNETFDTLQKRHYINSRGEKVTLNLDPSVQSLKLFTKADWKTAPKLYNTHIFLDKKDCLTVAQDCVKRGLKTMMMDAASMVKFGGGYEKGAGAQEENVCRRSTLCMAADSKHGMQKTDHYPLDKNGEEAGLYVDHVAVFRGEENEGYPYLDEPFEVAMGIVPAYNFNVEHQRKNGVLNPPEIQDGRIPPAFREGTKAKVHTFLQMAVDNGCEVPVFIAFGCGAFCTPPKDMCDLIMQVIIQDFPHAFKEIHFAITDDHNAHKAHNPEGNYAPFKEMIGYFAKPMSEHGMTFQENA